VGEGMTPARHVVGVFPRRARESRGRLFDALERCFPVRFEGREEGSWRALDAALVLPESERSEAPPALTQLVAAYEEEAVAPARGRVELSNSELLDSRMRGRSLDDERAGAVAVAAAPTSSVLASRAGRPVWTADRTDGAPSYHVALAPEELPSDECLRDRLRSGRFLALLPLVHFLREVVGAERWTSPPLRAAMILDDPNLHWPSYGFVRFAELAAAAEEHRFHVAIAMVPLDAWFAHPHLVGLFREKAAALSIVMHGNNHVKRELAQTLVDAQRSALIAQALRRVASFEQRTGIPVERVMTPPHGACSEAMMQTMARSEIEALCISNPRPWLESPPLDEPLLAWEPADFVGGLPLLPRYRLDKSRDDLVFRAFLDQPLILYGHHQDLATGAEALCSAADEINSFGDVRWCSPSSIARTNVALRSHSDVLEARLFARRVRVDVPAGIREIVAGPPRDEQFEEDVLLLRNESAVSSGPVSARPFEPFAVSGPTRVELTLVSASAIDVSSEPPPPRRLWPVLRRVAVETRDRLVPLAPSRPRA
jgi:hypothetical protein